MTGLRVLVVGAGVAGLTVTALLRRHGDEVTIVERTPSAAPRSPVGTSAAEAGGYALALWPHGTRVFHALDIHDSFLRRSQPMRRYTAQDAAGTVLTTSPLPASIAAYGQVGLIPRSELIGLLGDAAGEVPIRTGITIDALESAEDRVEVRLSDGTADRVDLVIGADGIGSRVRHLLLGPVPHRDTGWRCLVWWADRSLAEPGETVERYGSGSFVGTYPCRDRICVIVAVPAEAVPDPTAAARPRDQLASLVGQYAVPVENYLADLPDGDNAGYLWPMSDVRSPAWVQDRVALVGDAAAGFLPTAGIGASMALESAAVLADELSRTDATYLPNALQLYERRRKQRVEAAQTQSRRLARLMFLRSPLAARLRNRALRHTRLEQLVGPLITELRRPI